MKKDSVEVAGYTTLTLELPSTEAYPNPATHYLYIRPHDPRIPDLDSTRSLFLVNTPIDTTEAHIRALFATSLSSGRVEKVQFENIPTSKKRAAAAAAAATETGINSSRGNSKKRKRARTLATSSDLQETLDDITLPPTWTRQLQKSGSHAIVIFADKPSMEASLKAALKASKKRTPIPWAVGVPAGRVADLGIARYIAHEKMRYPDRAALLRSVNDFMTVFEQVGEARRREEARRLSEPDEDGFVTVSHGPKLNSLAREEELKALVEREKKKNEGLEDFYRFQSREKRKEKQNQLLRAFDEDKRKLRDIKERRGKIRVSLSFFLFWAGGFDSGANFYNSRSDLASMGRFLEFEFTLWVVFVLVYGEFDITPPSPSFLPFPFPSSLCDEYAGASVARRASRCLPCQQKPALSNLLDL
jgi:ribosomal RNA-processing protein 7